MWWFAPCTELLEWLADSVRTTGLLVKENSMGEIILNHKHIWIDVLVKCFISITQISIFIEPYPRCSQYIVPQLEIEQLTPRANPWRVD